MITRDVNNQTKKNKCKNNFLVTKIIEFKMHPMMRFNHGL